MPKVKFLPSNVEVEVNEGISVLDAALKGGVSIKHACGGFCACTTCHVVVKAGDDHLSDIGACEDERLERASGLSLHSRLACQAKVLDDVTVEVKNP